MFDTKRPQVPWSSTGALPDLQTNEDQAEAKIGELIIENGTVLRYVDFPPLAVSPMHRTQSLDYGERLCVYCVMLSVSNG